MFDIGWGEMVLIGVVALIAIGPKELPGVLRMVGQWIGKARRMAGEFQNQFNEALREAELSEVKDQVSKATDTVRDIHALNPVVAMQREFENAMLRDAPAAATEPAGSATSEAAPAAPAENAAPSSPAEPAPPSEAPASEGRAS